MIGIVDYGLGNIRSVAGAVERVGYQPLVTYDPAELARTDKLILPGVGAYGDGMAKLRDRGLVDALNAIVLEQKKPILGICLGFQLMCNSSCEFGDHQGLGWFDAEVKRLDVKLPLPHVGWNDFEQVNACALTADIPDDALFYYVHSYHVTANDERDVVGVCEYGKRVVAAMAKDNIYGTQFHPEKSQRWGLEVLHNFLSKA